MTIFENDSIKVSTTGNDYDFIAVVENKTNEQICVHYDEPGYNDNYDPILIEPNNWVGLLADEEGRDWIKAIESNQIYIATNDDEIGYYPTGCSMTQKTKIISAAFSIRYQRPPWSSVLMSSAAMFTTTKPII